MRTSIEIFIGKVGINVGAVEIYVLIVEDDKVTGHVAVKLSNNQSAMTLLPDKLKEFCDLMDKAHEILMERLQNETT